MSGEVGSIYGPRIDTTRPRIDFWHGVDWSLSWEEILEVIWQRQAWVKAHFPDSVFEDKPLVPGFSKFDLEDNGYSFTQYSVILTPGDLKRVGLMMKQYDAEHEEGHFFYLRPFCPSCRGAMQIARLSLCSWLTRHPGRVPDNPSDADLPWDTERVKLDDIQKQSELFMNPQELASMKPPRDLVEGIIPTRGVGYITGRDRSLKTFLALDIAMHTALMLSYWHSAPKKGEDAGARRKLGWTHYGRVIFAAGEGVTSFSPRIEAFVKAQHVKTAGDPDFVTPDNELSIRVDGCDHCRREKDPAIGHVYHGEFAEPIVDPGTDPIFMHPGWSEDQWENLFIRRGTPNLFTGGEDYRYLLAMARKERPDVIVLDTLALSSGSADQQAATDMGMVHDNARRLAEACDGVVIIIAHTDKGDTDARGSSVIEDNADFVLHCSRPENDYVEVKVAKRKDAEDGWSFLLGVETVQLEGGQSSLILRDWDGEIDEPAEDPEQDKVEDVIKALELAVAGRRENRVDLYMVQDETSPRMARSKVSKYLNKALNQGRVQMQDRPGKRTIWSLPTDWVLAQRELGWKIADVDEPALE